MHRAPLSTLYVFMAQCNLTLFKFNVLRSQLQVPTFFRYFGKGSKLWHAIKLLTSVTGGTWSLQRPVTYWPAVILAQCTYTLRPKFDVTSQLKSPDIIDIVQCTEERTHT